jgi:hypothetical protein
MVRPLFKNWACLRNTATLVAALFLSPHSLALTPQVLHQGGARSPEEILRESEPILRELVKRVSEAHREQTEENLKNVRATAARLNDVVGVLEKYLAEHPDYGDAPQLRERMDDLREYAKFAAPPAERDLFMTSEVDSRARLTYKPDPGFTAEARQANVTGRVRLLAILVPDGSIKHVVPLESLNYGMTEMSINAARQIRFEPGMRGGRPVSQVIILEYNFNS